MLVAISIPIFTTQLEKSRESVDLSNARAAYAEVMSAALTNDTSPDASTGVTYTAGTKTWAKEISPLKQSKAGWDTDMSNVEIGGVKYAAAWDSVTANGKVTVSYSEAGGPVVTWS